ncbi:MAG TPA: conjugal transfer protein TraR [Firmicutes bacterium]|jgi:YteA family regulatory protein|nr:conjugal transfer protein TraR [Bacillota bacterium]
MDSEQLNHLKKRLLEEKERIASKLNSTSDFQLDQPLSESISELSVYDNHPADIATETFEREKDLALFNSTQEVLGKIAEALENIEKGTYGICESCGRQIDSDRLEAMPYTTFCIQCEREEEEEYINRERPVEEEVLEPPFGRTFLDGTDVVGTDGEDTWQKVARYGTSDSPSDLGGADSYDDTFYDAQEDQGIVEKVEGVINHSPEEIPPDPSNPDQRD